MTTRTEKYDVIVVGGGAGGVGAAIGARKSGAKTLLLESAACLGGAASVRGVITYCGVYTFEDSPRQVVFGAMQDVIQRLERMGAITSPQRHRGVFLIFDPEANKLVLDQYCADEGVDVRLHSRMIRAQRDQGRIANVICETSGEFTKYVADAFVDATGEANLAHLAQASTRYGNQGAVNLGSLSTRFGGIPAEVKVTAEDIAESVERSRYAISSGFTKQKSVVCRLPFSADLVIYVASADYDPRQPDSLSSAERAGREQAQAYLQAIRTIPGCEQAYLVSTGPEFGTRESRHIDGQYRLTWQDVVSRRKFDDSIALGAWGAEWHERADYSSYMEAPPQKSFYEIPLGSLISRDTSNLFAAGRTVDGDQKAGAAIRVLATSMATGQASGIAAAQLAQYKKLNAKLVQASLFEQGCVPASEYLP